MIDIASTSETLVENLLNGRRTITYRQLRESDCPTFVKAWFHLGVETWYAPEYQWRNASGRFNYKDEAVQRLLPDLDAAVKDSAVFSTPDCHRIVEGALNHEVAYLNHPVRALSDLFFQHSEVVDGIHVVSFLSHFNRESFYTDAAKRYVVEHDDTRLDIDLFQQFLELAEASFYQSQHTEALKDSARTVSELLGLIDRNGNDGAISAESWQFFARIRGLQEKMPEAWSVIVGMQGTLTGVSIDEMAALIAAEAHSATSTGSGSDGRREESLIETVPTDTTEIATTFAVPEPEPAVIEPVKAVIAFAVPEPEPAFIEPVDLAVVFDMPEPAFIEPVDLAVVFDVPETGAIDPPAPSSFALPTDYAAHETRPEVGERVDVPSSALERPNTVKLTSGSISNPVTPPAAMAPPPVEINDKLEKMFVKKLFNKDEAAYQATVNDLEPALSWEEAFSIIEEIWQHRGLNLFSKESQEFTRVYYERYFPCS